jgi:outer membrane protein TolC
MTISGAGRLVTLMLAFIAAIPLTVTAAERTLSLKEALSMAMTGNPQLRALGHSLLAEKENIGIARSYLLPKLIAEERFMRTSNPAYAFSVKMNQRRFSGADLAGAPDTFNRPDPISDFQSSLSLEQALFAPKASIGVAMSKKEVYARTRDFDRKQEEVALNVFKMFLGVQTAKAYVVAAEMAIEDAQAHLRVSELRYREGIGIYSDVLRSKVAVSTAAERRVSAKKDLETGKRALGLMLGLTESIDVIPEKHEVSVREVDHYYEASLSRSDLKAMEQRSRNAENLLKLANAGYLPVVGIGGSVQANDHKKPLGAEGDSWQVMAFLRWELFDGTKREHERDKARHKIAESEEYLSGMKKEIAFQVYEAYLGVGEARDGQELARAALAAAEEGMRIVRVRYENSLASMIELIDMQSSLDASRAGTVAKEAAYLTSVANLWFQSGRLFSELGIDREGGRYGE